MGGDRQAVDLGVAPSDYEILIIDNNSSDATPEVVADFSTRASARALHEPRQGVSHARNRALAEARGEWVVFVDDDIQFEPGWLAAWLGALQAAPRGAAYAGGPILPEFAGAPPRWFRGERLALIDGMLGWFDLGREVRPFTDDDPTPFGANMAVLCSFALRQGGFRIDLGIKGRGFGRGEETEFVLRARRAGAGGLYVGSALCRHRVAQDRFTLRALFRYGVASGLAHRTIVDARAQGSFHASLGFLARGGAQLVKGRGDRFRQCIVNAGIQAGLAIGEDSRCAR